MEFRLLGPLEVWDGERAIPLGGPKQRAVLAHLLLHANEVVSTDALIDDIWGETPPEAARNSLQTYISLLRKALGGRIEARSPGYVIHLDDDELDALRFERLVIDARGSLGADPSASLRALQDAHALWRGTPLADLADEPSFRAEISRLEELHAAAIEDRIAAQLAAGNHAQVIGELENLVRRHPLREGLWAHLIVALYRSSRQADALDAYAQLRRTLADELGIDPSPELKRLHEQVLAQDVDAPVAHVSQPVTEIKVFLIADVRGYTRFTQERGDEAGARLAERFASLTRERVEAAGGSVIELRGDGALAVFGSSRQALRAAVQLQERFMEETSADPTLPFGVGIGLDAGEAVPVENGYRGGSLNVAARLCALAAPGEVLASSEVVHLARRVEGGRGSSIRGRCL